MDYAFMSKTGESKSLSILVTKDRSTHIVMPNMVMHKGGLDEVIEQGCKTIRGLGVDKG